MRTENVWRRVSPLCSLDNIGWLWDQSFLPGAIEGGGGPEHPNSGFKALRLPMRRFEVIE